MCINKDNEIEETDAEKYIEKHVMWRVISTFSRSKIEKRADESSNFAGNDILR